MSGLPPRQPSGNQSRELVFCHQCRNEWYRDQHGLVCPECESDFTEILEHDASAPHRTLVDSDDDYDEEDDGFYSHHRHHHADHDHRGTGFGPAPHGTGFTLRMGGGSGPQISFRTIQPQFGSSSGSPGPQHPFGGGHVIGGISPNPRQPSFPSSPFDHFHAHFPGAGARSMRSTPQSDPLNQQRDDHHQQQQQQQQEQQQQQQQQQQRSSPAATSNFGNASQPVMDIFASIVQTIMGVPREGDPNDNTRNQQYHVPGAFPGGRSPPMAGQNNLGQGSSQAEGLGGPGHSPGTVPSPGGWSHGGPPSGPHGGSPHGMESPLFMQMPRGRGGVTYYSSTRTWTGPNGEVRTIRTSSPMPPHGQQGGPEGPGEMNLASILVNIIGSGAHGDDGNGFPPLLRAFGLGHGQTGDYAWNQQDMDRILSQLMEQHQGNAPPPASEESIRNLSKVKVTQAEVDDGSECVVCQDEYKVDDEVVKLPCKHIYHEECVTRWLETHDACPICRTPITPEDQRRQRPTPGAPPGASGPGFPPLPGQGGSGGPGGSGGAAGGSSNMHTSSGSGGSNGARWTWSTSFGRG